MATFLPLRDIPEIDITLFQRDYFDGIGFVLQDDNGLPIDLTSATICASIYQTTASGTSAIVTSFNVQKEEPSPRNPCVDSWIRYVLKPENLALLAQKQWMFPVYHSVTIPPFFQHVPAVRRIFELESDARVVDAQMKSFELELFGAPR